MNVSECDTHILSLDEPKLLIPTQARLAVVRGAARVRAAEEGHVRGVLAGRSSGDPQHADQRVILCPEM